MADLPISSAATLTSATLATGDLIPILDISAGAGSKGSKITAAEHKKYLGKDMDANVAYVRTGATGGTVGNPADPYGNITAAYAGIDTTTASAGPWLFDLDTGAHILTLVTAAVTTTNELFFRGAGPTTVVTITVAGADGDPATSSYGESITFGDGSDPFVFASDHSCSIAFNVTAGDGGSGSVPDGGGGSGGSVGGRLHIKNAIVDTATFSFGVGAFGDGLESGNQGPDGTVLFDDLSTINCEVTDVTSPTIITSALDSVVNGAFNVGAPAGSGSELQFRSSGTAFGAVTGTSVSGGTITGGAHVGLTNFGVSMADNTAMTGFALGTITDTTSRPFIISQTWNNASLIGTGLKVAVTNTDGTTASFASLIFDFQSGAVPATLLGLRADGTMLWGPLSGGTMLMRATASSQVMFSRFNGSWGSSATASGNSRGAGGMYSEAGTGVGNGFVVASDFCFGWAGNTSGVNFATNPAPDTGFKRGNVAGSILTGASLASGWVNQRLSAAGAIVGTTTNGSPTNTFTITGSVSTGTGSGGALILATYGTNGASGTAIGTLTTRIECNTTGIGFFAATPVAKPTGVAVDAAGIHAALVSLGLIAA